MDRKWCCSDFASHANPQGAKDGVRLWLVPTPSSTVECYLEFRSPDKKPSERFEGGIRINFCPWCGANLDNVYGAITV
jgi:hypothetical protein